MSSLRSKFFSLSIIALFLGVSACNDNQFVQGERLYNSYCENCHMENGQGLGKLIPPLQDSDYYLSEYENLLCVITKGMSKEIVVNDVYYKEQMPAVTHLTTAELSNLINYMNSKWYPNKSLVTLVNIKETFTSCE